MRRVKGADGYLEPSRHEIQAKAKEHGLKAWSTDFVLDLASRFAGADMRPWESIQSEIQSSGFGKNWTEDQWKAAMSEQQNVFQFLSELPERKSGNSPLTEAVMLIASMSKNVQSGGEAGPEGASLPIFSDVQDAKEQARKSVEKMDTIEKLSKEEKELLEKDPGGGQNEEGAKVDLAKDLSGDDLRAKIASISRMLSNLSAMKASKKKEVKADPDGRDVRYRSMQDLTELPRMGAGDRALLAKNKTLFYHRVANRAVQVRERITITDQKQLLYLLLDCSGSMGEDGFATAGGALMNRLTAVVKEEAELYWRLFDVDVHKEHYASNKEEARKSMDVLRRGSFSGGGTNIQRAITAACDRIEELTDGNSKLGKPQVLIVTDGEDGVNADMELKGITVHVLLANKGSNESLEKLAKKSGGLFLKM